MLRDVLYVMEVVGLLPIMIMHKLRVPYQTLVMVVVAVAG